ncbi:uncharacterized protein LOC123519738 [Portunus trituberculatus]|uniref:uncharacterized protein LOC123519738 n=1 Tax=Portunus trituberculatus TaxID=210409 RepID=UPI001E1D21B8|nr:uncharacterized protein LOC123519738 [Portunus trituberculatus]
METLVQDVRDLPLSFTENLDKLGVLVNFVSPKVYETLSECGTYDDAISNLKSQYDKTLNEVFARHLLATRRQQDSETLDDYLRSLRVLSRDCNFKAVTEVQHCEEYIRDTFINGLRSPAIRQRLLENKTLNLTSMFDQVRALESAQKNSESYQYDSSRVVGATSGNNEVVTEELTVAAAVVEKVSKCFFCGSVRHPRAKCPARKAECHKCHKKGHFARVCRRASTSASVSLGDSATLATASCASTPNCLFKAVTQVFIGGMKVDGLIVSGSSQIFIHPDVVRRCSLTVEQAHCDVTLASTAHCTPIKGCCSVNLQLNGRHYPNVKLAVPSLCSDVILGQDFRMEENCLL